jgi:hypothetical protein
MEKREYLTERDEVMLAVKNLVRTARGDGSHRVIIGERDSKSGEWKKEVYLVSVEKLDAVQEKLLI